MSKKHTIRLIISLCLLVTQLTSVYGTDYQLPERGLCAHRGDWTLAPEDTVPAFISAALSGAQQVEFDIKATKDGKLVIMHDPTVDRTTNGSGTIRKMTFQEIRELKVKTPENSPYENVQVPTFEEALSSLPRNIWINAHLENNEDVVLQVAEIVKEQNRFHQVLFAVEQKGMDDLRAVYPDAKICCMQREKDVNLYVQHAIDWKCDFIQLNEPYTSAQITALKNANIKINYFGTDDPNVIRQLLNDGIDFPLVNYFSKDWYVANELNGFKLNIPEKEYMETVGGMLPFKFAKRGLCAHRGDQSVAPENTIPSFLAAVNEGAQQLELDVQMTKDGRLVIMHDSSVDRTTNGQGLVKDLSFKEIRKLDAGKKYNDQFIGVKVPTFEEVLEVLPRNIIINIHVKPGKGIAKAVTQIVMEKKRESQALIACENKKDVDEARAICPSIKIAWLTGSKGNELKQEIKQIIEWKCNYIQLQHYDSDDITTLKDAGIIINFFGTDDPEKIRQLFNDGIDFPLVNNFSKDWSIAREFDQMSLLQRDPSYQYPQ